jgi:serine/threonine protein kinase
MGEVYKAATSASIASSRSRFCRRSSRMMRSSARFDREARAISQLDHPNICTLHDVGVQDGMSYLVMQYLEGETLDSRLRSGPLPLEQPLQIGVQIAGALDKSRRAGIVHRDPGTSC